MKNFSKYNVKIKRFIGRLNIKNDKLLDENNNELTPYEKKINT